MDWKTFIVELVSALAWPLVVLFTIFQLKDRLAELIPRLRKLKHKDTELEFAEKLNELAIESATSNSTWAPKNPEMNEQFHTLQKLSELSPRSAVIESFRILETALSKALIRAYPEMETKNGFNPALMRDLIKNKILNEAQFHQFNELRKLRNQAAHLEDFDLKSMPIPAYIDIALTLANNLETPNL